MDTEIQPKKDRRAQRDLADANKRSRTQRIALRFDFTKHAESIPALVRGVYLRSQENHSLASALKAKCQECVGYEDVANRVHDCSTYRCPLWKYRPYQDKAET